METRDPELPMGDGIFAISYLYQYNKMTSLQREPLALPTDAYWNVYLTTISGSTDSVMIRFVGEAYSDQLDLFENTLEEEFRKETTEQITVGMICVAHTDERFHRVKVLSIADETIACFFLDHGDIDKLNTEDLRPLDTTVNRKLPYQVINVSLHGLGHVSQNETALDVLDNMALRRSLVAYPIAREDSIELVLYDTSGEVDININEEIIQQLRNNI